jgi:hypothetical protein
MTFLLSNWRLVLIASLGFALMLMTTAWQTATAQKELAESDLRNYKHLAEVAATTAKSLSDHALKETRDAIPLLLEQAKTNAYKNYLARHGAGNAACGIRLDGLRPASPVQNGQAGSAAQPDELQQPESVSLESTIVNCAIDAGYLEQWKRWATLNELPVSKD